MKILIVGFIHFLAYSLTCAAQNLPQCINELNKTSPLTTTKFKKKFVVKGNILVYQFAVGSKKQCMDCPNGSVFYDSNCNMIARFMMARGASAFVAFGFTAADFGKAGYPNVKYELEKPAVSKCMNKAIANTDSLNRKGIIRVTQLRIKNKVLYHFEYPDSTATTNCKDCTSNLKYYGEDCRLVVTFTVGGIAAAKADSGFTPSDFYNKQTLRILWNK